MQITPELIEHTEFHTGLWLQNVTKPGWYYFTRRINPNIVTKHAFIESVDPPLRKLVAFLHKNRLRTTPSCAGHSFPLKKIEKLYHTIEKEAQAITTTGIYLKDVQTDRLFAYRNKNYELPWTKSGFTARLMEYQVKGILGIRVHPRMNTHAILDGEIKHTKIYERDNILFFLRNQDDETGWKKITQLVIRNVKS